MEQPARSQEQGHRRDHRIDAGWISFVPLPVPPGALPLGASVHLAEHLPRCVAAARPCPPPDAMVHSGKPDGRRVLRSEFRPQGRHSDPGGHGEAGAVEAGV